MTFMFWKKNMILSRSLFPFCLSVCLYVYLSLSLSLAPLSLSLSHFIKHSPSTNSPLFIACLFCPFSLTRLHTSRNWKIFFGIKWQPFLFYLFIVFREFFTLVLADSFSLEFERQQVSSNLEDCSQYSGRC